MSSGRPVVHQDYIARIRYSNALPPPPCPPKLLDIPNTGLSSGQYTSAGFASRLAREQPLNIEADAELGMPIDLVGIPKVFDGDESAIQPAPVPKTLHPADRALMRQPGALGKGSNISAAATSFLRRTEYSTAHTSGGMKFEPSNSGNTMRIRRKRKTGGDTSVDDPVNIARHILKGFNIAYPADAYNGQDSTENLRAAEATPEERAAWKAPKNPRNPSLKLLDSYPLFPDWDATPDTGGYMVFKYNVAPINDPLDRSYDPRLDVALLRPAGQTIKDQEIYQQEREAYKTDPNAPRPLPRYQFDLFLPPSRNKVAGIKRNFTTNDPDDVDFDNEEIDEDGNPRKYFKYEHVRTYEVSQQNGDADYYGDVVALALHDPDRHAPEDRLRNTRLQKGAYFYPVIQKTYIRPRRPGHVDLFEEVPHVDVIEGMGRDPVIEVEKRDEYRKNAEGVEV